MKNTILTFARTLFAIPFLIFGFIHLSKGPAMAGLLMGWPVPVLFVYIAGVGFILAGVAFIINRYVKLAAWLLALEILIITLAVHVPGLSDPHMAQLNLSQILKNTGLIAGALMIAGFSRN